MATAGGADAESYAVELALPSFAAFYEQHNPKHGRLAKRLLQMHAGNEEKLFDGLVTKYGDAAVTDLVTGISQAAEKAAGARLPSPSGTKDTVVTYRGVIQRPSCSSDHRRDVQEVWLPDRHDER